MIPQPYYSIGVIDWALAYRGNTEMRADYNKDHINKQVKDTDPPPAGRAQGLHRKIPAAGRSTASPASKKRSS